MTAAAAGFPAALTGQAPSSPATFRRKTILLRGSWQTINIGDIAHTPGFLQIARTHLPEVQILLWPSRPLDRGVEPWLRREFPQLEIVQSKAEVDAAHDRADFMVQGSAASPSAATQLGEWARRTGKPYGFFGITVTRSNEAASPSVEAATRRVLDGAAFLFTRETRSLANVRDLGVQARVLDFVPDATFSMDLRDDASAAAFLREHRLTAQQFVCVIPRLRYTPYYKTRAVDLSAAEIERREAVNAAAQVKDGERLRGWITEAVRRKLRVVLCAEMTYQLDLLRPMLYDPLPASIQRNVVVRDQFWLPHEAASLYRQAAGVISCECHSPILAAVQGTPAVYLRQTEDGIKGQMWADLGLGARYRDLDTDTSPESPWDRILRPAAASETQAAVRVARERHAFGAGVLRAML